MLVANAKNPVKKGDVIFTQGEKIQQVGIVLAGKVQYQGDCIKVIRGQGSFLALNDLDEENYSGTYTAIEDSVIYGINCNGVDSVHAIVAKNADFRAIMVSSQFKYVTEMSNILKDVYERSFRLFQLARKKYEEYEKVCQSEGLQIITVDELIELKPYEQSSTVDEDRLVYFAEASKIPLSANKVYFAYSEEMVSRQVFEILGYIQGMKEEISNITDYIKDTLSYLGLRMDHNLFNFACVQGQELRRKGNVPEKMVDLLEGILEEVSFQHRELMKMSLNKTEIDEATMRKKVTDIVSQELTETEQKSKEEKEAKVKRDLLSLKNSMDQIIKYGELEEENAIVLKKNVEYIVNAPDRLSVEDDVKKAKKSLTPIFFNLYLKCYRKYRQGVMLPKAAELFLNFGMLDERLLETEQLEFLCGYENEKSDGNCNVFTMVEWLDQIQEGKRDPSKSEFDEDYVENLRTLRKQGDITEEQQKALLNDMDKRVEYEVMNMQMANSRTLYGQPTAYMPILYKEALFGYMDKIIVTKKKINEAVEELKKLDYSVFYREVIYSNNDLKIINETVMKEVYPDVILFPLYGVNASMWQEVGGKNKGTPGRFCFPILCSTNLDELMVKMFGRFRWELCRCIQGMSWNDVKVKSLTSEYCDYIQFYRKNRELSDEAREKVKLQIQKGRNNTREIFLLDYEAWIKNESNGSMKMNKVARELLATYCPFEKGLRAKLGAQRPYEVAMARGMRNNLKKKQEFELKIKALQKDTDDIPKEILDTYEFFSDL